jgi:hypothetical protein
MKLIPEVKTTIGLAIAALQRCADSNTDLEFCDHFDTALKELGDMVSVADINPNESGISLDSLPVLIQLKLMSRGISLSRLAFPENHQPAPPPLHKDGQIQLGSPKKGRKH